VPATSLPSWAGWYRDPEDPIRLKHWNGRGWDARHRTMPAWAVGVEDYVLDPPSRRNADPMLEGPVHRAALPAIATASAQSYRPAGAPGAAGGLLGARRTGSVGGGALHWSGGARPPRRPAWPHPRSAYVVASALVGLVVVILVVTVGLVSRPTTDLTLAQDSSFIRAANIACGESMGAIWLPSSGAKGPGGSAVRPSPAEVAAANADLTRLEATIRALPVVASAASEVQSWLDTWGRFAVDRQRLAVDGSGATGAGSLTSAVAFDVAQANAIVSSHGLTNCRLGPATALTTY
jgi:hypothetical protein